MRRLAKILNFTHVAQCAGLNPQSFVTTFGRYYKGKLQLERSEVLKTANDWLNSEIAQYITEDKYEILRVCAMAGLVVDEELGQQLKYDYQRAKIMLVEFGKEPVVLEKNSPALDLIYGNLFKSKQL